jgi:cysteine synthase A
MKPRTSTLDLIGNTPLVRLKRMAPPAEGAEVWAKLESFNPGGSVKDRIALSMVEAAERDGALAPGGTIVEPTSGNTGIGLALVAAVKGYRLVLAMSEAMSVERRLVLQAYGAELLLTPKERGMMGALDRAALFSREHPEAFMPLQFENPANPDAHRRTTAPEIIQALEGVPDALVVGVGTGGTITGIGETFRQQRADVHIAAVEPAGSPILSGGEPGTHRIPGIGAGFFPGVLNTGIYDEVIAVGDHDAENTAARLALEEGVLAGVSSGAAMWAAQKVARRLGKGKKVVVVFPDGGERYLSTGIFGERNASGSG